MTASVTPIKRGHARGKAAWRANLGAQLGPISSFLPGYELHLRAKGQAEKTIEKKLLAVRQVMAFLGDPDVGTITRADVEAFIAKRFEQAKRSSVATSVVALRAFFGSGKQPGYLAVDLGGYDSPMAGIVTPDYEEPVIDAPAHDFLGAILTAVEKKRDKEYEDLRDAALLRCFIDTGCRLSEITNLTLSDILPLDDGRMLLRVWGKGKGGGLRERHVPLGEKAGVALRRYQRVRANHPHAASSRLWLGRKGPLTFYGVRDMLYRRSEKVGQRINPHKLRHAWAISMKSDERNRDSDIQHLAGWSDPKMLARYGRAVTGERAMNAFYAHGAPGDRI